MACGNPKCACNRKLTKSPSGLVYPTPQPEKPARQYGALELRDDESRKIASKCFCQLRNLSEVRGSLVFAGDRAHAATRDELLTVIAKQLLGQDWDCEILC